MMVEFDTKIDHFKKSVIITNKKKKMEKGKRKCINLIFTNFNSMSKLNFGVDKKNIK